MFTYITHPICKKHDNGDDHPENSSRLSHIEDRLIGERLLDFMIQKEPQPATDNDILRVHKATYLEQLKAMSPKEGLVHIDAETVLSPESLQAARLSAGAVIMGIDELMNNRTQGVFCNVRPPGHHAELDKGMGFCLLNNAAIGAAYALENYEISRIAILDFDVHHGNGTESFAEIEPKLQFISSYEDDIYPFANSGSAYENILKLPMPRGTQGGDFIQLWEAKGWPFLLENPPELIIVSAGFDAHRHDLMAGLDLFEHDFANWARSLLNLSPQLGNPKILSVLEGGYELQALGKSVSAYIKVMADL